ncbi:MAG: DUF362 domain-containing protein [Calditrichaceae bacterium]|nr:DUF362 domain-containing protein [Calditrichaceae bacterium]MBN2710176.1 DUF362 domain-containing protein [Calditrichaceae bacterium]
MLFKNFVKRISSKDFWMKLFFPFLGIASLIWFLIRVIPKPSRATYPCMQIAAPIASSFVIYVLGLLGSITAFRFAKIQFNQAKYLTGALALAVFLSISGWFVMDSAFPAKAKILDQLPANEPVGEARGIFPGRVVWSWNPEATNENCANTVNKDGVINNSDDVYYLAKNNNMDIIKDMMSEVLRSLTGTDNDTAAWDSIFHYYNRDIRGITAGYTTDEKIFIKTNNQGVGLPHTMNADLSQEDGDVWGSFPPHMAATSPQATLAILDQLVNKAGVPQDMIYVGDPHICINDVFYDIMSAEFPDVHYLSVNSDAIVDCEAYGRTLSVPTDQNVIFYSDKGTVLDETTDKIYQQMYDATYMINIASLKSHVRGGITLFEKSHFGSHTRSAASHLHPGLPRPYGIDFPWMAGNYGYGKYRVLVDLMGHKEVGGKTMLFILDALWGGAPNELEKPRKWDMEPFNGDYTSSIFASIDNVAISSVAHDFLRTEYNSEDWDDEAYPNYDGTDDYLQQAADSSFWPDDITYDPEDDGTPLKSLGVHEHWNNADDKQYSRDLQTGNGIELVKILHDPSTIKTEPVYAAGFALYQNFPNPFNPSTSIAFQLKEAGHVELSVYNELGQKIETLINSNQPTGYKEVKWNGANRPSGVYFYRLIVNSNNQKQIMQKKMLLVK